SAGASPRAPGREPKRCWSQSAGRRHLEDWRRTEAVGCINRFFCGVARWDFRGSLQGTGAAPKRPAGWLVDRNSHSQCGSVAGGLDTVSLPDTDSTRSLSPINPEPPPSTAPPTPLSLTDTRRWPSSMDALTWTVEARACLVV